MQRFISNWVNLMQNKRIKPHKQEACKFYEECFKGKIVYENLYLRHRGEGAERQTLFKKFILKKEKYELSVVNDRTAEKIVVFSY